MSEPGAATSPVSERRPLVDGAAPRPPRRGRVRGILLRLLVGLGLAVLALGLGLLVAYVVSLVRGQAGRAATSGASPSTGAGPAPPGRPAPAPSVAELVPSDWTRVRVSSLGLTVRHPPAWTRYPLQKVTVWGPTTQTGGRGVDEVGVGLLAPAPAPAALDAFARSFFAGQPGLQIAAATGTARRADLSLTYRRTDVPVRVVLHGERGDRGVLLTLARAAASPENGAALLLGQFRAGVSTVP